MSQKEHFPAHTNTQHTHRDIHTSNVEGEERGKGVGDRDMNKIRGLQLCSTASDTRFVRSPITNKGESSDNVKLQQKLEASQHKKSMKRQQNKAKKKNHDSR